MKTYFLHGLGQTAQAWNDITKHLPEVDTACIDLFTYESSYADVFANMEKLLHNTSEKIRLCGMSLGAVLALDYSIRYPDQVDSLILIGAQYKMPTALLNVQNLVFRLMPKSTFSNTGLSKAAMIRLSSSMKHLDFTQELSKISCPVAVVCGEKDRANRKAAQELSEKLPNAVLYIVPECSHEVNVLKPNAIVSIITERWTDS